MFEHAIFTVEFLHHEISKIVWLHSKQKSEFMVLNGTGIGNHWWYPRLWGQFCKKPAS